MLSVALTGGIATGKSFCLARFAALGAAVIDADRSRARRSRRARRGWRASSRGSAPRVLLPDGSLDRAALGRLVFSDRAARADLEAIVHPRVYRRIGDWFANLPPGTRVALADIPLLFETGPRARLRRVVVCACAPAEQLRRLMARDGLTDEDARARLAAQWPIAEKVSARGLRHQDRRHASRRPTRRSGRSSRC